MDGDEPRLDVIPTVLVLSPPLVGEFEPLDITERVSVRILALDVGGHPWQEPTFLHPFADGRVDGGMDDGLI